MPTRRIIQPSHWAGSGQDSIRRPSALPQLSVSTYKLESHYRLWCYCTSGLQTSPLPGIPPPPFLCILTFKVSHAREQSPSSCLAWPFQP